MKLRPIRVNRPKDVAKKPVGLQRLVGRGELSLEDAADILRDAISKHPETVTPEAMVGFMKAYPKHYAMLSRFVPVKLRRAIEDLTMTRSEKEARDEKKDETYGIKKPKVIFKPRRGD